MKALGAARGPRLTAAVALLVPAVAIAFLLFGRSGSYEVVARFDQAHGLVQGAEVQAAGIGVGKVVEVSLGDDGYPLVRMTVDDGYRLRTGATADLRMFSVAGSVNRYVLLRQGSGRPLHDGAILRQDATDQPVEIDQVLSTLDPATRADVRSLLHRLDRGTRGRGPAIEATLRRSADGLAETAALVGDVTADGEALRTFVRDGRAVVGALARDPDALGAAADELAATLRTVAHRETALSETLAQLAPGLRSPRRALERTRGAVGDLRTLVAAGRPVAQELVPFSGALRPALREARPALAEASKLITQAPADLRRLDPLLADAGPVLERLAPVLRSANPMLDQLRVRLPDVFSFFANWADFTANYDANGHAARVGLVFEPAPLNETGPDDDAAGQLAPPFARTPGVLEGEPWRGFEDSFVAGGKGR